MSNSNMNNGPILNIYPDSLGGNLHGLLDFLKEGGDDIFQSLYLLPSIYNTDLDRGFSVIDYELNEVMGGKEDIEKIQEMGIQLKLDFVLNHCSVLSPQFQDLIKKGQESKYADFFIDWNAFWEGCGVKNSEGIIEPEPEFIKDMFFRKPGLPILKVLMPDGNQVPYWNTFYQSITYPLFRPENFIEELGLQYLKAEILADRINDCVDNTAWPQDMNWDGYEKYKSQITDYVEQSRRYLGQMDLNIQSPKVWEFYKETIGKLASYGASIIRLDAFAYAAKAPGKKNFFNEPDTWDLLAKVKSISQNHGISLLPEIHSKYEEKIHEKIAEQGYMTYDFFLPGLILDAIEYQSKHELVSWLKEVQDKGIKTVNMLGCHDGIPLLDLKGLLSEERIEKLIETVVNRGGLIKNLHGKKDIYYQVNATYFSALGESEKKLLLARALQLFSPGKPQIWYLDLFAGKNDYDAVGQSDGAGHKEINRTNLSLDQVKAGLKSKIVKDQMDLIRFRNNFKAFTGENKLEFKGDDDKKIHWVWSCDGYSAELRADLNTYEFSVEAYQPDQTKAFNYISN